MVRIRFITSDDGYASGSKDILHYDGVSWSEMELPPTTNSISSVFPLAIDNIWSTASKTIYHWDGTEWSTTSLAIYDITDIYFNSADDGWVVDLFGQIFHYNGTGWSFNIDIPIGSPSTFEFFNSSDGWLSSVNEEKAYRYDGNSWTLYEETSNDFIGFEQLQMLSPTNIWAVGRSGRIGNFDGSIWTSITSPTSDWLYGIYMISPTSGWAVGNNGVILRYK